MANDRFRGTPEFDAVRNLLIQAAKSPADFVNYATVMDAANIAGTGDNVSWELGKLLGEISTDEHEAGRPMLSSMAVSQTTGLPGSGFKRIAVQLRLITNSTDEIEFWLQQVAACRAYWGKRHRCSNTNPPLTQDFVAATKALASKFTKQQIEILRMQFAGPHRSITATRIAEVFGYDGFNRANIDYGLLASKYVTELDFDTETNDPKDKKYWRVLATGDGSTNPYVWYMRPELAEALVICDLVSRDEDGSFELPDVDFPQDFFAFEGKKQLRLHLIRERSPELVKAKKASVTSYKCEVCAFDSLATYGSDYCEVHHKKPISSLRDEGERISLDDLAIVCANCHRQIHLQRPPVDFDQFKAAFAERRMHGG